MSTEYQTRTTDITVKGYEIPVTVRYGVQSGPLDTTGYYSLVDYVLGIEIVEITDRHGYDITDKLETKYPDVFKSLTEYLEELA